MQCWWGIHLNTERRIAAGTVKLFNGLVGKSQQREGYLFRYGEVRISISLRELSRSAWALLRRPRFDDEAMFAFWVEGALKLAKAQ
jgi:hypothetical protein